MASGTLGLSENTIVLLRGSMRILWCGRASSATGRRNRAARREELAEEEVEVAQECVHPANVGKDTEVATTARPHVEREHLGVAAGGRPPGTPAGTVRHRRAAWPTPART
jgi:hypothetical protein